jgi:hypothetical protein
VQSDWIHRLVYRNHPTLDDYNQLGRVNMRPHLGRKQKCVICHIRRGRLFEYNGIVFRVCDECDRVAQQQASVIELIQAVDAGEFVK